MTGESVIYLAEEWGKQPTGCDHVFEHLARHNKVLWVNNIAARNPNLTSAHDWGKIFRKIRMLWGGLTQVRPMAWVYQPVAIPLPYSSLARAINRYLLRWSLRRQARKLGLRKPQLWTFLPNVGYLVGLLDETLVVYYCLDYWSQYPRMPEGVTALERDLAEKADICLAVTHSLAAHLKRYNRNTFVALHGVDHGHFAQALQPGKPPADVAGLPQPIIGFFGGIEAWIDLELVAKVAQAHPEWSVVLIGESRVDTASLRGLGNVHLLGRRPYASLPDYCRTFAVGIIPFVVDEMTTHANPVKLREYLSAGLPVVSTDLPEVRYYEPTARIGRTHDEFVAQLEQAVRNDSPEQRRERSEAMRGETWDVRVAQTFDHVMDVLAAKNGAVGVPSKSGVLV